MHSPIDKETWQEGILPVDFWNGTKIYLCVDYNGLRETIFMD